MLTIGAHSNKNTDGAICRKPQAFFIRLTHHISELVGSLSISHTSVSAVCMIERIYFVCYEKFTVWIDVIIWLRTFELKRVIVVVLCVYSEWFFYQMPNMPLFYLTIISILYLFFHVFFTNIKLYFVCFIKRERAHVLLAFI